MKIIKKVRHVHKFVVMKGFTYAKERVQPGDEIEIFDQTDQDGFVSRGLIRPTDLPPIGKYVGLRSICLPGRVSKFESKPMELLEIKADDALKLMLSRTVLPADPDQWRPYGMTLRKKKTGH
jgi:hypothetical protein